jgi:hypothetical protein
MRVRGLAFTMDALGEAVVSEVEAMQCAQIYRQFIERLTVQGGDVNMHSVAELTRWVEGAGIFR